MIPRVPSQFKRAEAFVPPARFAHDPVANDYDAFFSVLNFEVVLERDESKPLPGNPPHPERAYLKAQLVMIREKIEYHTQLRRFLVRHPALVLRLGFRPVVDPSSPWGFDVERTVPCDRHLRRKLQYSDNGTVKGDLHDIGKNMVGMMLEGAGFTVIDLGIDVSPEQFIAAIREHNADLVGMSALITTTMVAMKETVDAFQEAGLRSQVKILVGGAPVTQRYANEIGADGYAPDAASAMDTARQLLGQ